MWNGVVIAESADTVRVEGNHYFPPESVRAEYLRDSPTRTLCPWKGVAHYRSLAVEGMMLTDGAWHPHPTPLARKLKGRVAFWHSVTIEPATTDATG